MSRRKGKTKIHDIAPDPVFGEELVARFINFMMSDGKKSVSERIFYQAMQIIKEKGGKDPLETFHSAMEQVKPALEVRSRRVGGVTYQVPREVRAERMRTLSIRWLVTHSRGRKERGMAARLAAELMEAAVGNGGAVKKRNDTRRMADANKAFSHYRW